MTTTDEAHFAGLEGVFYAAPINEFFSATVHVEYGLAKIEMEILPGFHHAGRGVHGAVIFKLLDDSAFFAACSVERDYYMLTSAFTTYFLRPVGDGSLRASGKVLSRSRNQVVAESVVYDRESREVGRGSGVFVRSEVRLDDVAGYRE